MALVRFGSGVTQMSGSIGGDTHARNRFGNYIRPRTKPVNPRSARQMAARLLIMMLAEQWRELPMTDGKRGAWGTYAQSVNWNNKLGETVKLTGFNMFIRGNAALLTAGGSLITDGPEDLGLPAGDPSFVASGTEDPQLLTIAFDEDAAWAKETGAYLSVEMGRPQNETRNFFNGPWRNAGSIAGVDSTGAQSPATLVPPFTLVDGQKVWVRARVLRKDARASTPFRSPPFVTGGLLPTYNVQGTTSPDYDCNYQLNGAFNGKAYFKRTVAGGYIWWDGDTKWLVTEALGILPEKYWYKTANPETPEGSYTGIGGPTGACTVAAGTHE